MRRGIRVQRNRGHQSLQLFRGFQVVRLAGLRALLLSCRPLRSEAANRGCNNDHKAEDCGLLYISFHGSLVL